MIWNKEICALFDIPESSLPAVTDSNGMFGATDLAGILDEKIPIRAVPAFSGLGAPYWDSSASAVIYGMTRLTKKPELVRAALDSIAYQITDVIEAMAEESKCPIQNLRVDGGPTRNTYLMQMQSDISGVIVEIPSIEELSGIGAAYAAGIYQKDKLFGQIQRKRLSPQMPGEEKEEKYRGWQEAVSKALTKIS